MLNKEIFYNEVMDYLNGKGRIRKKACVIVYSVNQFELLYSYFIAKNSRFKLSNGSITIVLRYFKRNVKVLMVFNKNVNGIMKCGYGGITDKKTLKYLNQYDHKFFSIYDFLKDDVINDIETEFNQIINMI